MQMHPRTYVVIQRPYNEPDTMPEIVIECDTLDTAKYNLVQRVRNSTNTKWLAKNGRSGIYYNEEYKKVMRLWIKRKRSYP